MSDMERLSMKVFSHFHLKDRTMADTVSTLGATSRLENAKDWNVVMIEATAPINWFPTPIACHLCDFSAGI